MAAALLLAGYVLVVAGTAVIHWPAALIVAGVLLLLGGYDLARP